jgi:hypothetical protein
MLWCLSLTDMSISDFQAKCNIKESRRVVGAVHSFARGEGAGFAAPLQTGIGEASLAWAGDRGERSLAGPRV